MDTAIKLLVLCLAWFWPLYALRTGRVLAGFWFDGVRYIERRSDPQRFWYAFAISLICAILATAILFSWKPD